VLSRGRHAPAGILPALQCFLQNAERVAGRRMLTGIGQQGDLLAAEENTGQSERE
jgi:hypothetical protein